MTTKNYLDIAYQMARECCDDIGRYRGQIDQIWENQKDSDPEFVKTNLLGMVFGEKNYSGNDPVRFCTRSIIDKHLLNENLVACELHNQHSVDVFPNPSGMTHVILRDYKNKEDRESDHVLYHYRNAVAIIQTETEEFKVPFFQTRIWPIDFIRVYREQENIRERTHPIKLLDFAYGLVRDFIFHTFNYAGLFNKSDGCLKIDALQRTATFNREPVKLYVTGKMYKHMHKDTVETALLSAHSHRVEINTPEEERTIIRSQLEKKGGVSNERCIQHTMTITCVYRTERYECLIPFTQIRRFPVIEKASELACPIYS